MIRSFHHSIRQPAILAFAISASVAGGLFQHASGQQANYVPAGWQTLAQRNHQRAVEIEQKVQHYQSQIQPVASQPMVQAVAAARQVIDTRPYRLAEPVMSTRPIRPAEPQLSAAPIATPVAVPTPSLGRRSDARPFRPAKASQPFRPAEPSASSRPVRIPAPLPVSKPLPAQAVASDFAQPVTTAHPVAPAGVKQPSVSQPSEAAVPRAKFLANASEQSTVQNSQLPEAWTRPAGQQPTAELGQPTVAASTPHAPTTAPPDVWLAAQSQAIADAKDVEDIFANIQPFKRNEALYQPVSRRTVEFTSKPALIQKAQKSVGNEKPANETPRLPPPSGHASAANVATPGTAIANITRPKVTTPKLEQPGLKKDAATQSKVAEVASYKPNPPRRNRFFVEEPEVVQQPKPIPAEARVLSRGNVGNYTRQSRFFR